VGQALSEDASGSALFPLPLLAKRGFSAQSDVSHSTIWRIAAVGKAPLNSWFIESIQRAFEEAGIEFTNSGEAGVRLRQQEMR
jgi:hypothetical protein